MKKRRLAPVALLLILLGSIAAGCSTPGALSSQAGPTLTEVRFVAAPDEGEFTYVSWYPALNKLVVDYLPKKFQMWDGQFYTMNLDGTELAPLAVPADPGCKRSVRHAPRPLPDGRLGYIETCLPSDGRRFPQEAVTLRAYDPATGEAERLRPYYLPFAARLFDFGPTLEQGNLNDGVGLEQRLHWLTPERLTPLNGPFVAASGPAWSPDGQTIAFGSALENSQDEHRLPLPDELMERPQKLYLMSSDGAEIRSIAEGFAGVVSPSWSPDSRWLLAEVVFTYRGSGGAFDLWLIEAATGRRYSIGLGAEYGSGQAIWLPDGRTVVKLAGFVPPEFEGIHGTNGLYVFELPDLDPYVTAPTSAE